MAVLNPKRIALIGLASGSRLVGGWYISPSGFNLYQVAAGDTFALIAGRFLGSASRGEEIWNLQSSGWQSTHGGSFDNAKLFVGDQLFMPQEAVDNAKAAGLASGGRGAAPTKATSGKTLESGTDVLVPHGGGGGGFTPAPTPSLPSSPSSPSAPSSPAAPSVSPLARLPLTKKQMLIGGALAAVVLGGGFAVVLRKHKRSNPVLRRVRSKRRRRNPSFARIDDGGC